MIKMKKHWMYWSGLLFMLVLVVQMTSCSPKAAAKLSATEEFRELSWILGMWGRSDLKKPKRKGLEIWTRKSPTEYVGEGVLMEGKDTIFREQLKLILKDKTIYYVAEIEGNPGPVYFEITESDRFHFISENPEHSFPKVISYFLESKGALHAEVSGDGNKRDYFFMKLE